MSKYLQDRIVYNKNGEEFYVPKAPRDLKINNFLSMDGKLRGIDMKFLDVVGATPIIYDSENYLNLNKPPYGWCKISSAVEEHQDGFGRCLLFLGAGAGTLFYETPCGYGNTYMKPHPMVEGSLLTFDDRVLHAFELSTKTCSFMIVGVKKKIPLKIEEYPFFIGNL